MGISVVIPTCGRPDLLTESVGSVLCQSEPPLEIVIIDDSPSSGAVPPALPASIQARGIAVLVLQTAGSGASTARNRGAAACTGEVLAFLDDDDLWAPGYLRAVGTALRDGAEVVCAGFLTLDEHGSVYPEKDAARVLHTPDFLLRNPGLRGSNLVIRASTFARVGGFDPHLPSMNDLDFGYRLAALDPPPRYAALPERLVYFRQHGGLRLSTPRSLAKTEGVRRFFEKYSGAMTAAQQSAYRSHVFRLWEVNV